MKPACECSIFGLLFLPLPPTFIPPLCLQALTHTQNFRHSHTQSSTLHPSLKHEPGLLRSHHVAESCNAVGLPQNQGTERFTPQMMQTPTRLSVKIWAWHSKKKLPLRNAVLAPGDVPPIWFFLATRLFALISQYTPTSIPGLHLTADIKNEYWHRLNHAPYWRNWTDWNIQHLNITLQSCTTVALLTTTWWHLWTCMTNRAQRTAGWHS